MQSQKEKSKINIVFHNIVENKMDIKSDYDFIRSDALNIVAFANDICRDKDMKLQVFLDDGYKSHYDFSKEILDKFGLDVFLAIINSQIDKENYLTINDILELKKLERVHICAHGFSHASLSVYNNDSVMQNPAEGLYQDSPRGSKNLITENEVRFQIDESVEGFKNKGISTIAFVYPYGIYNNFTVNVVKDGGFSCAYTCDDGIDILGEKDFKKPRFILNKNTSLENLQKRINYCIILNAKG